jgi:hypothetical protein
MPAGYERMSMNAYTRVGSSGGSIDLVADDEQFVADILASQQMGLNLESYLVARDRGLAHCDLLVAFSLGIEPDDYTSLRMAGPTHDQVLAVHADGWELSIYLDLLTAGCTHDDFMAAAKKRIVTYDFVATIKEGADFATCVSCIQAKVPLNRLRTALAEGVTCAEFSEFFDCSGAYLSCRAAGISHADALRARDRGVDLRSLGTKLTHGGKIEDLLSASQVAAISTLTT